MSPIPATSPLYRLRQQARLVRPALTVLLMHNGYMAQGECERALQQLGHRVVRVGVGTPDQVHAPAQIMGDVLRATVEHRPDMLLGIDHIGFDRHGGLAEALDAVGLPTAIWYVDSPFFLQHGYTLMAPDVTTLFVWDRIYIPLLQACGACTVMHLPLATEPQAWANTPAATYPVSFVGHSGVILTERWQRRLDAAQLQQSSAWQQALLESRHALPTLVGHPSTPPDAHTITLAHATFAASKTYRLQLLRHVPALHVFGDAHWRGLLPATWHANVAYGPELARIYAGSTISLNATSLQMPGTVNQRVFDVPAAGGFVLTDAQAELSDLFDENEMARYDSADALQAQLQRYGADASARTAMVHRAQKRIGAQHTYVHRMQTVVRAMREIHAR